MNCPRCHSSQTSQCITCQTCHHLLRNAQLRVLNYHGQDQIVVLPLCDFIVGRDAGNDLVLSMEGISRRHARFYFEQERYWIEDCGSKNGLFVNDQKVAKTNLEDQDCLQIGPVRLFFFLTENTDRKTEPPPTSSSDVPRQNTPKAGPNLERKIDDEQKWREFFMQHFLQGALRLSDAGIASLWLPDISSELTLRRQMNAGKDASAPLSHEPWQQLAERVFQSGDIVLRERAETTNPAWENLMAIAGRSHRVLGIPLREYHRPAAPAGVLLLEDVQAKGCLTKPEAQRLQQLIEQSVIHFARISRAGNHQNGQDHNAGHRVSMNSEGGVRALAVSRYDIAYVSRPSGASGGDYLEVMAINEAEWVVAIVDAAGKGEATKLRDRLQTCLCLHVLYESRPEALAQGLHQLVFDTSSTAAFTTLFLGVLNLQRGVLRYVNAGHNPGVMIYPSTSTPRFESLPGQGAALGVLGKIPFVEKEIAIRTGATLIFSTAGLTDATGAEGKQHGLKRLIKCAAAGTFSAEKFAASQILDLVLEDSRSSGTLAASVSQPEADQSILVMAARA